MVVRDAGGVVARVRFPAPRPFLRLKAFGKFKRNAVLLPIAKIRAGPASDSRIETVKKIADALGVTLDDLMK